MTHLLLDQYGSFLGVEDGLLCVRTRDGQKYLSAARRTASVTLGPGTAASSDAFLLCMANGIPVIIADRIGRPQGLLGDGGFGSIATLRRNQALFGRTTEGWDWVCQNLIAKIEAQQQLVGELLRQAEEAQRPRLREHQHGIKAILDKFGRQRLYAAKHLPENLAATFRGWEGSASRHYFSALSCCLPVAYRFEVRSRRPAQDPFNATLNYLYGMLYALTKAALIRAGVDPWLGVMHADEYNRPAMVFDAIEAHRHYADQTAWQLFGQGQVADDWFGPDEQAPGGLRLLAAGKGVVVQAFHARMARQVEYQGRQLRSSTLLDVHAGRLAKILLNLRLP